VPAADTQNPPNLRQPLSSRATHNLQPASTASLGAHGQHALCTELTRGFTQADTASADTCNQPPWDSKKQQQQKKTPQRLFANLIFPEGGEGGQQYLGLRPGLRCSLTSILLELQDAKSPGQVKQGAASSPAQPQRAPGHLGRGATTAPAPSFKPCGPALAEPPSNPFVAGAAAIALRGAPGAREGSSAGTALLGLGSWLAQPEFRGAGCGGVRALGCVLPEAGAGCGYT